MLIEESGEDDVPALTSQQYERLRRGADTYRQDLILRLGAEVGLRPAEMTRVTPEDVYAYERGGRTHYFLDVPEGDAGAGRRAYLPDGVEHDVRKFARAEGIGDDERLVPVTPRRVQMLIAEIAERTADRTGDDRFENVSSRTLRRYFARQLLDEEGVHPGVVRAVGGWDRLASLEPYLSEPDVDDVAAAFERTSLAARGGHGVDIATFRDAVERTDAVVYITDGDGTIEYVNEAFERVTGYDASEAIGRTAATLTADESHDVFEDDRGDDVVVEDAWTGHVRAERKDGDPVGLYQTVTPIVDGDGRERYVAVATEESPGDERPAVGTARLDAVLDRIRDVSERLATTSVRGEIEQATCEGLVAGDAYRFAWAGKRSGTEFPTCASAGIDEADLAEIATADGASARAMETGELYTTTDVAGDPAFESWASHAAEAGYGAAAAVPIVDGSTTYGVLHLATDAEDAFDERERALLRDLGERMGQALTAAERRKLLLADTVVELAFKSSDSSSFFVTASERFDCTFTLEGVVPGEGQSLLYFVMLEDADDEAVLQWASERAGIADVRLVRDYGDESLVEFVVTGEECSKVLTEQGGTLREMSATDGVQRFVGVLSSDADVRETVHSLTEAFPGTELHTKREREKPTETAAGFTSSLEDSLTEKQIAVLRAAHHAGYFEWPRGSTAEELADSIGITSPTLHNHLRRGLQKLLVAFLEDQEQQLPGFETPWNDD